MGKTLLSEIIDEAAIKQQVTNTINLLDTIDARIKQINDISKKYKAAATPSDLKSASQELEKLNRDMVGMQKQLADLAKKRADEELKLAKALRETSAAKLNDAKAEMTLLKAKMLNEKQSNANAAANDKEAKYIQSVLDASIAYEAQLTKTIATKVAATDASLAERKALEGMNLQMTANGRLATDAAAIEAELISKRRSSILIDKEILESQAALRKANSQRNVDLQGYKIQTAEANKAAKEEALTALGLLGPYQKLSKQYEAAAMNAKNLAVEFGVNSKQAKAAAVEALALNTQLQTIDKTVGQSQRNVGNYTSAFSKVWGAIRQAAYILPGIGIAGIMNLAFDGLGKLTEAIGLFSTKTTEAQKSTETLTKSLASSGDGYQKAVKDVEQMTEHIDLAKKGLVSKTEVLKEYNDGLGKTMGQVKNLDEAEKKLTEHGEAYIKMMLYKAAANLALDEAAKKAFEAEQKRVQDAEKQRTGFDKFTDLLSNVGAGVGAGRAATTEQENERLRKQRNEKRKRDGIKESEDAKKTYFDIAKKFQKEAGEISKSNGFDLFNGKEENKKHSKELKEEFTTALDEIRKRGLQIESDYFKGVAENEKISLQDRLGAYKKYIDLQTQINNVERNEELKKIQEDKSEKEKQLKAELKNKEITQQQYSAAIANIEQVSADNSLNVNDKHGKALIAIRHDTLEKMRQLTIDLADFELKTLQAEANKRREIQKSVDAAESQGIKDEVDMYASGAEQMATIRETAWINEQAALIKRYKEGKISYTEYQNELEKATKKFSKNALQSQIDVLENQLSIVKVGSKEWVRLSNSIAKTKKELIGLDELPLDKFVKKAEVIQQMLSNISTAVNDLGSIGFEKRKQQLDNELALIERNGQAELARIQTLIISEQDKANLTIQAQAKVQADKEANDRKQRKLALDQARFERLTNIGNIITGTSLAVINTLKDPKLIALGLAIPLAVTVGIMGAAQLAKAIATPLPKYAKGTSSSKEGFAITDELGPELYKEPGGKTFLGSNDGPTLRYLKGGTKIIPHSEVNKMMFHSMLANTASDLDLLSKLRPDSALVGAVQNQTVRLEKALAKNRPIVKVINRSKGFDWNSPYITKNITRPN